MRHLIGVTLLSALAASSSGAEEAVNPHVALETTKGRIVIELLQDEAPKSVENFLAYVRDDFYSGTIFHRVIPDFMVQGGGFTAEMRKKPTRDPIQNEADNGVANQRGTVAMARTNDPHSATAQFFFNTVDNAYLNHKAPTPRGWGYTVFGRVVEGMDVVDAISATPTSTRAGMQNVPNTNLVIESATVIEAPSTSPETAGESDDASHETHDS